MKSQECQTDMIVRWEEDVKEIVKLKKNLPKMQRYYEQRLFKLTHIKHLEAFKHLACLLNDRKSITSLLLSMRLWENYSKMLLLIYANKHKRDLTTTYKDQGKLYILS